MKVRLVFKVGDQFPVDYFKRNMGCLDGMLVDYYAEGMYWPELSDHMKKVYAIVEMDVTEAEWPTIQTALAAAVEPKPAWIAKDKPDYINWRARKRLVTLSALATALGDSKIETQWRDATVMQPKPLAWATVAGLLKDSTVLNPPITDLHIVTAGVYDVGSAAGDDYASWAAAAADTGNQTNHLQFQQNSDLAAVATAVWTHTVGAGFIFNITSNDWHHGNTTRGNITGIGFNGSMLDLRMEGPGTVNVYYLRFRRTTAGAAATSAAITINSIDTACLINLAYIIHDGYSLQGCGILINDTTPIVYTTLNLIYACNGAQIDVDAANATNVTENNTCNSGGTGIDVGNQTDTYRRNACYANTTDFANRGNATGDRNQSDDATAANANWAAGTNNQINGDPAVDFNSGNNVHPKYVRPTDGGVLELATGGTYLAGNINDIGLRPWATYGYWIGCKANPGPVTEPDFTDPSIYVNGSQYAFAFRKFHEATHADTINHPLVLTEANIPAAMADTFWATVAADGSDIVITNAVGTELATEIVGINVGAQTMTIWAKYDDMDDQEGDADGDAVFMIQWGGTGRTLASTAVYDGNYNSNTDHHAWWHLESAADGTAEDAAGHYDLTEGGTIVDAAAQVDNGSDFESGDAADCLYHANAGNFEFNQAFTVLAWLKRENIGAWMTFLGRFDSAANANRGWAIGANDTNLFNFTLCNDSNPVVRVYVTFPANVSVVNQFIVGRSSGSGTAAGLSMFYNHILQTRTTVNDTLAGNTIITGQRFNLGVNNNPLSSWYDGIEDEMRIVPVAMIAADIRTHYNNEYSNTTNGVWDWGTNLGTYPTPSPSPSPTPRRVVLAGLQTKIANTVGVGVGF